MEKDAKQDDGKHARHHKHLKKFNVLVRHSPVEGREFTIEAADEADCRAKVKALSHAADDDITVTEVKANNGPAKVAEETV